MIVLDTNVLSEAIKPAPSEAVLRWLATQDPPSIFTTTVTQAEFLYGVEIMPQGKRRTRLSSAIEKIIGEFQGKILPFDEQAAVLYAKIAAARDKAGRPMSQFDAMIASIALSHGSSVATRDTADFEGCGIRLINPWNE